jgi:hypothetical protein
MPKNDGGVDHKGHEITEGDKKHPSGRKRKSDGLGHDYGQGVGYGGYGAEQDQAQSQTGTADHKESSENSGDKGGH